MGKPKKGKKGRQEDDFGDDDDIVDPIAALASAQETSEEICNKPAAPKGKKGKKKGKKEDDWDDDDLTNDIGNLVLDDEGVNGEEPVTSKQRKKDKKKKKIVSDEEEEEENDMEFTITTKSKATKPVKGGLSAFQMLDMEESDLSDEEDEREATPEPVIKQKSLDEGDGETSQKQSKKGKKDKKKPKKEEEDIDAILAELGDDNKEFKKSKKKTKGTNEDADKSPTEETKPVLNEGFEMIDIENMTQDDIAKMLGGDTDDEDDFKKKKKKDKKKKKKEEKEADELDELDPDNDEGDDEIGATVKTAAQKKKEKRERQKQQKLLEKQKQKEKGKKSDKVKESTEAEEEAKPETKTEEIEDAEATEDKVEGEEDEADSKKSKKDRRKKKGKEEKEEKDKKKKPASAQLKAMQEALQKIKEEEARLEREEAERVKREEAAREAKLEKERLEKEKKEKEKQKKKERIDRLKQEGKYLTPKQREAQKRAQQMLEAMRAQGREIPDVNAKQDTAEKKPKKIVYENKKKKKPWQQKQESSDITSPTEEVKRITPEVEEKKIVEVKKEEVKAAEPAEIKDAWDAESDEEPAKEEVSKAEVEVTDVKKEESDEESEEEESDDDSESESEETDSSDESDSDDSDDEDLSARDKTLAKLQRLHEAAEAKRSINNLRAPVVCVLGHVDTGKTKILDKLRRTNVQDGEAGGITQQIGATNVPVYTIKEQTKMVKEFVKKELNLPGLLIIDTPGHESFSNLRTRGSSLCDIAILVVDIMHGLEPQTIESLNLLKKGNISFVVALNKVDRLFQWQSNPHNDVRNTINKQKPNTKLEFEERAKHVMLQFSEQGMNTCLYYDNKNPDEYISLIPTSAHSGDGMGNLIALICELCQTKLAKRVSYSEELQATVMEVKALPGLGTTIDVILVNGSVREGQKMVVAGTEGPISTTIRGLLMPQPLKELRVKNAYQKHKEVIAAQGVKIIAKDLDHALAGLPMYIAHNTEEEGIYKEEIAGAIKDILAGIKVQDRGVFVQASTIGSLEALLEFLRTSKIPYAGINIGPVHKKDIMKASVMLEHDTQYAVILAFDVKVEREAQEMADNLGIRIFCADIIYHLFDQFMAYRADLQKRKQEEYKFIAVFPSKMRILPQFIFNSRDPIVCGVVIEAGFIKEGTPVCVPSKEFIELGRITSIELNHKQIDCAKKGQEVCIKIEPLPGDTPKMIGRHFAETDQIVSKISRQSIDAVKNYFRDEMSKSDWQLIMELKKTFQIL